MPDKKVQCSYCLKVMRSDNLKNHVKIHERAVNTQPVGITGQKRQHFTDNVPTTDREGFDDGKPETLNQPKNPKIQALRHERITVSRRGGVDNNMITKMVTKG